MINAPHARRFAPAFAGLLVVALAGPAHAVVVLMDFGSTTAYTGADSPAHAAGDATGSTWNGFATDKASGFVDENGNPVLGLSVDFGVETVANPGNGSPGSRVVNYSLATKSASATHTTYPVFNNAAQTDHVVRDGASGTGTEGTRGLGIAVEGLASGVYEFYFTGFRGDSAGNAGRDFNLAWEVASSDVTDFTSSTFVELTNSTTTPAGNWIAGDNYLHAYFTLAAGENLYLFVESPETNGSSFIGVANSLVIASVPTPSALAAILPAAFGLVCRRRRR